MDIVSYSFAACFSDLSAMLGIMDSHASAMLGYCQPPSPNPQPGPSPQLAAPASVWPPINTIAQPSSSHVRWIFLHAIRPSPPTYSTHGPSPCTGFLTMRLNKFFESLEIPFHSSGDHTHSVTGFLDGTLRLIFHTKGEL